MEASAEPVLYHQLRIWEASLESGEEEEEEEELAEPLVPGPGRPQHTPGNKVDGLPGVWARLVAALLLLVVGCSLAVRQLHSAASPARGAGPAGPPGSSHAHRAGVYHHSAIVSPAATCSQLGQELLVAGGNVVDAGVGAALCLVVVHPHATGLGATFWGLFYNSSLGNATALTPGPAQTLAPGLGLPAALPALHLLHSHFGRLPWPRLLVGPTTLARDGFTVDSALAGALAALGTEGLCPPLCHADGTLLGVGARATNPSLAAVLLESGRAPSPELAGDALLRPLAGELGLAEPPARPAPSLQPALQLSLPQGTLFTTPGPSAGPDLLVLLEAALHSGAPSPRPCPLLPPSAPSPGSSALASVDSGGSVLLLISALSGPFGSGRLSPRTGVLLSNLEARPTTSTWACPLVLRGSPDDTEASVLGLVASGTPEMPRALTQAVLRHLAGPQTPTQHQDQHGTQGPTESPATCGRGTLLQVASHTEHAHVSTAPNGCCPFQGF